MTTLISTVNKSLGFRADANPRKLALKQIEGIPSVRKILNQLS